MAAYNAQGLGPFSQPLEVKPEPSLALTAGARAAEDFSGEDGESSGNALAWIIPVLVFIAVIGLIFAAAVLYVRRGGGFDGFSDRRPKPLQDRFFREPVFKSAV